MGAWRGWLRAARPLAHANVAPAILLGQALGHAATGRFSLHAAVLVHALGVLDHLAIVWVNDLDDEAGDRLNDAPTPFSGGSRVLVEGALGRGALERAAALACVGLLGGSVIAAGVLDAWALVPGCVAALVLLWAYSGRPLRLSHRSGGVVLQGLGIGIVLPGLGAAAQGALGGLSWTWLVPPFLLGVAGHVVTSIPDEIADRRAGKRTLAVARGGLLARRVALALVCAAALLGWLVLPGAQLARGVTLAVVLAATVPAWAVHHDAGPVARRRCLLFVVALGGAITAAFLGWSLAAVWT